MGKKFKLILTVLICTGISFAQALSVGGITVETALNQPLKASIGLRNIGTAQADDIVVSLAKPADFKIADIEYLRFLNDLRFTVVALGRGAVKVEVTSKKAIREPYVNFLLSIVWPNGQVLKEYTVLLDPVFGDTSLTSNAGSVAAQVQQADRPRSTYLSNQSNTQAQEIKSPQRSRRLSRSSDTASSVTVLAQDTLWKIAQSVAPKGVSVHQVMHAIKQANPNAFINNNINGLKAGYQLVIPSVSGLQQVSNQQAISATRRDTALWSGSLAVVPDRSSAVRVKAVGELQLAVADDSGSIAAGEQLDALTSKNDNLVGRLGSLEEQVDDLNRLLELKNKQLALLQQQAQAGIESEALTVADEDLATAEVNPTDTSATNPNVDAATELAVTPLSEALEPEVSLAASLAANQPLKGALPKNFQPSLEWWQQAPIQLASLGGFGILLLAVLWLRRSRDEETFVVEDGDVILETEEEEDYIPLPEELDDVEEDSFDELENLSEQFESQDYDIAMAGLEAKVTAQAHRADLRLLLLQKASDADDKDRFTEHYRFLEAIAKPEDLQTAERILTASQGSLAWLSADGEDDDFFKEIVHEAELTDEIEALLLASEGEASVDDFDFENFDDALSLDEVSLDAEFSEASSLDEISLDESYDDASLLEGGSAVKTAEADVDSNEIEVDDDQGLDFEETVILAPAATTKNDESGSEDDDLDFDFDAALGEPLDAAEELDASELLLDLGSDDLNAESAITPESAPEIADVDTEVKLDEFDIDFGDFSFGDDELDTESSLDESVELIEGDEPFEDDDSFDLENFDGFDDTDNVDTAAVDDLPDLGLVADENTDLGLQSESEIILDEGVLGDNGDDEGVFDAAEDSGAQEISLATGDTDDFEDFSGFLDGSDEAEIADEDEVATKLELGEAFIEMDDIDSAREILTEVFEEGDVVQQATARELLDKLDS